MSDEQRKREAVRRRRLAMAARRDLAASCVSIQTLVYATQPTKQGPVALHLDLYLPPSAGPVPVAIWLHAGGFWTGTRRNRMHAAIAAAFARHGYATLVPDYRLQKPNGLLRLETRRCLPAFFADAEACGEEMQPLFWRHAAMAVLDDMGELFGWLSMHRNELGLAENVLLAGSSAGGITALNTAYLLDHVGFPPAPLSSVAVLSGGFAYPSFAGTATTRILALHNPSDVQVPVSSIRRLAAQRPDTVTLVESEYMVHGALTLVPGEALEAGVDRLVRFDRDATAST